MAMRLWENGKRVENVSGYSWWMSGNWANADLIDKCPDANLQIQFNDEGVATVEPLFIYIYENPQAVLALED